MGPRSRWDARCTAIVRRNAGQYTSAELARLIEAQTGLRFSVFAVSRRRAMLDLDAPRRNDWTAPLQRWRPWSGAAGEAQKARQARRSDAEAAGEHGRGPPPGEHAARRADAGRSGTVALAQDPAHALAEAVVDIVDGARRPLGQGDGPGAMEHRVGGDDGKRQAADAVLADAGALDMAAGVGGPARPDDMAEAVHAGGKAFDQACRERYVDPGGLRAVRVAPCRDLTACAGVGSDNQPAVGPGRCGRWTTS